VERKEPAGKLVGGGTRKRVPRCVGRFPGEGESPGELRARRALNRERWCNGLRWWSKAVKVGRPVVLFPEACERHGVSAGRVAEDPGGERQDGNGRREAFRLPRRSKALEGETPGACAG
jgi:hypothetical protein